MTLGDLCTFSVGDRDADFWVIRRGEQKDIGRPEKTFDPEHIAVKVTRTDVLLPQYLFYMMQHMHNVGYFVAISRGSTPVVNITPEDLSVIPVEGRE